MIDNLDLTEDEIMYYKAYTKGILDEIARKRQKNIKPVYVNKVIVSKPPSLQQRKKPEYPLNIKTLPKEYCSYYTRAFNKNKSFELTIEQFYEIANSNCQYCGCDGLNGIDRVDNKIGYTFSNCVPCCTQCNHMKFVYSKERFLKQIAKIYQHNNLNGQN